MEPQANQRTVLVRVAPLPAWLEVVRLLGDFPWQQEALADGSRAATARLPVTEAALLQARLRGLGMEGHPLQVTTRPALHRTEVREGRLQEARARRVGTLGFSRSDARAEGEGRYSLTPEPLALALGKAAGGRSVVDACCGSGGNAIAFARLGSSVVAIDIAPERLAEARGNARVYGVEERIRFIEGDALALLATLSADILFVDPPWGESYDKLRTDRRALPLLDQLLRLPLSQFGEVWLKVPASFVTGEVAGGRVRAWFGEAPGDRHRIKFLQVSLQTGSS